MADNIISNFSNISSNNNTRDSDNNDNGDSKKVVIKKSVRSIRSS